MSAPEHLRALQGFPSAWWAVLEPTLDAGAHETFLTLSTFLASETAEGQTVLPPVSDRFAAFANTLPDDVRVVIVGQDPYPTPGHANGLAFSYSGTGALPRSLRNVQAELERDLGLALDGTRGDLTPWAKQGVLLLNRVLSVRAGEAGSHQRRGWEALTDAVIAWLGAQPEPRVFLLWGKAAQRVRGAIGAQHHILEAGHPSPLSVRFFQGCGHFSATNRLLRTTPVDWSL